MTDNQKSIKTSNESIMLTADDASKCKKAAVLKGYWEDPFISTMITGPSQKKTPEINRGYFARNEAVWSLVNKFIVSTSSNCQIISLGAGLDTLYWRLQSLNLHCEKFIEFDFPDLIQKKIHLIESSDKLKSVLNDPRFDKSQFFIQSHHYHLIGCDLQDLELFSNRLKEIGVDFNKPTMVLAECVLMYMKLDVSDNLIKFVSNNFTDSSFVSYDTCNMNDTFGQVMISNLKQRQCWLHGVDACQSLASQRLRFERNGWNQVQVATMWQIYQKLPNKSKIEKLEFFDETELLQQLLEHYCIVIACNSDKLAFLNLLFS